MAKAALPIIYDVVAWSKCMTEDSLQYGNDGRREGREFLLPM